MGCQRIGMASRAVAQRARRLEGEAEDAMVAMRWQLAGGE